MSTNKARRMEKMEARIPLVPLLKRIWSKDQEKSLGELSEQRRRTTYSG